MFGFQPIAPNNGGGGGSGPYDCPQVNVGANPLSYFIPSGVPFSASMNDFNSGNPANSWSVISGSLPPGLTLNTTSGVISGTPTTTGTYNSDVYGTNSCTDSGSYQVVPIQWDVF